MSDALNSDAQAMLEAAQASSIPAAAAQPPEPDSYEEAAFDPRVDLGDGDYVILRHPDDLSARDVKVAMRGLEQSSWMSFAEGLAPFVVKEMGVRDRLGRPILPPSPRKPDTLDAMPPKKFVRLMAALSSRYLPFLMPDLSESDDPNSPTRG